jgi:hypothetical protein
MEIGLNYLPRVKLPTFKRFQSFTIIYIVKFYNTYLLTRDFPDRESGNMQANRVDRRSCTCGRNWVSGKDLALNPDFSSETRFLACRSRMLQDLKSIALSTVFLLNQVAI